MNKFKKVLLGALSVLTLGLFVVTGAKVNAEDNNSYVFDTLTTEKDATLFGTGDGNGEQLGNTIFYAYDSNKTKSFCYDKNYNFTGLGLNYASGLYLKNTPSATRHVKVVAPSAGTLKLLAYHSNSRTLSLYDSSYAAVSPAQTATTLTDRSKVDYIYFTIPEEGTYCLNCNGSIGFYNLEFIPFQVFQQEASDSTYSYVRFISIVESETALTASNFNLSIKMTYNDTLAASYGESYTRICTPRVVTRITNGKDANDIPVDYVATINGSSYTFNGHTNTYYVVFVIKLTTATFTGSKIQSTLTYNGQSLTASESTI